jgi:arylsulfatase A-like enzyme
MPTFLELAGASYPKTFQGHAIRPMEGRSLLPVLEGEKVADRPFFYEHEGNRAVREGRWKLVALSNQPWELHDFEHDRSELHNLVQQQPDRVTRLSAAWDEWAVRCLVRRPKSAASDVETPRVANKALTISCEVTPESRYEPPNPMPGKVEHLRILTD